MKRTKLIEFRENKGLSKEQIAEKIGIGYTHYTQLEAGTRSPSYKTLIAFKKAFNDMVVDNVFFNRIGSDANTTDTT